MAQLEPFSREFAALGATLVYIAAEKRHGVFRPEKYLTEHPVSYPFLLDEDRQVTKAYGVYHALGADAFNIARPATFVADRAGIARFIYVGQDQRDRAPVEEVLQVVKRLSTNEKC
jgi:peroxiredoxin